MTLRTSVLVGVLATLLAGTVATLGAYRMLDRAIGRSWR